MSALHAALRACLSGVILLHVSLFAGGLALWSVSGKRGGGEGNRKT
jgi:hypothetical protein